MAICIEGIIQTTRPLHCATALDPDLRYDYATRRPTRGNTGMPLAGTVTKGVLVNTDDRPEFMPYFPSNNIRGRLRRKAARVVLEAISARDDLVTIDTFDGMNAGNFRGRPDNTPTTLVEMQEFRKHFFMGLFGGGPRTLPSKLVTHDLDPICAATLATGTVPKRYESYAFNGKAWDMTEVIGLVRRDDTSSLVDLRMMTYIKDAFDAVNNRQDELSIARNKRKKQMKSEDDAAGGVVSDDKIKKDDLANMFAYQCIRTGLPLYLELGFTSDPTKAQIGLLLESLLALFNENRLGGRVALGFGRFDGHANLVVDGHNLGPILQRHQAGGDQELDAGFVLTDLADEYVEAKDEALDNTSSADLERFFIYGTPVAPLPENPSEAA